MQIQLHYDLNEDRLRFIVSENDDNRAWWITRRAAIMFAEALATRLSASVEPGMVGAAKEWALSLRQEEAVQNNPITNTEALPTDRSHLLNSIRHGRDEEGRHVMILVALDGEEQGFTFDDDSLFAVMELFRRQLSLTGWGLEMNWPKIETKIDKVALMIQ